ncbi:hypothetical protein OIU74_026082 [Salix koriyanagi]|uniref:Uncharacterized protein n=1 Tax=Salix koriyanagi TaxID=2511006 RepID=A0A9Q0W3I6_9ROSI|nr:hypothetical protein OIU74_026082 [Salix koriyanagi]
MKNPWHRVAGIVIASAIYHIWKERNNRMHNQIFRSAQSTRDDIINNVRERLANLGREFGVWIVADGLVALGELVVWPAWAALADGLWVCSLRRGPCLRLG